MAAETFAMKTFALIIDIALQQLLVTGKAKLHRVSTEACHN